MDKESKVYFTKDFIIKVGFIILNCLLTIAHQIIYRYEPSSDSLRYIELANQYSEFNFFDPVTNCYGHSIYALFLLVFGKIFSFNQFVIGIVQSIIFSIFTLGLVSELEKIHHKKLYSILLLVPFIPQIYFYNGYILTESLSFSLIIFAFYLALKIYRSHARHYVIGLAFVISINILNRIETAVIIFPLMFLIYPVIKTRLAYYTIMIFGIVFLSLQWNGYRNCKIYGIYKLSAFNGGEVIYGGNNQNLDGSHHPFSTSPFKELFIPADKWSVMDEISSQPVQVSFPQHDSLFLSMAIDAWKNDPFEQLTVIPDKLAKNWLLPGMFDIYTSDTTKTRGLQIRKILSKEYFNNTWYAPYKHLFYILIHWAILLCIVIGIIQQNKNNRFQASVSFLLILWLLFAIPFCGLPRWHVAVLPLLIITFMPTFIINKLNRVIQKEPNQKTKS